jgi:hypothetical protein
MTTDDLPGGICPAAVSHPGVPTKLTRAKRPSLKKCHTFSIV